MQVFALCLCACLLACTEAFRAAVARRTSSLLPFQALAEWSSCAVVSNKKEAEGLQVVEVEVPAELGEAYTVPGQYVKIKATGVDKPGFYAIASSPGAAGSQVLQFLVKGTENNQFIYAAKAGEKLELSGPQGKGFSIADSFNSYKYDFPTVNVLMMATGSGLAPIAAAIDYAPLQLRKIGPNSLYARTATLYVGARTEDHLPFRSKYSDWESKGVTVVPVISKPADSWRGRTGYVQDSLRADGVKTPRNTGVLLCGHRGMTDNVKEICLEAGVFEGRLLLNF